jgi:hypothetical protein
LRRRRGGRCSDRGRRFFDRLFDNRRFFFDCWSFGHDHDRGCFINFDRRWRFDLDNGWRWRDNGDRDFNRFFDNGLRWRRR